MTEEKTKKLQEIFRVRMQSVIITVPRPVEAWADYLNRLDCIYLDADEVNEDFEALVNDGCFDGKFCIVDPFTMRDYILVPRQFAEKILVLGGLP
jgi:hypothetical protein